MTAGFPGSAQSGFWSMAAAESVFDAGQLNLPSPQFKAKLRFAFHMSSPRRQDFADVKEQQKQIQNKTWGRSKHVSWLFGVVPFPLCSRKVSTQDVRAARKSCQACGCLSGR